MYTLTVILIQFTDIWVYMLTVILIQFTDVQVYTLTVILIQFTDVWVYTLTVILITRLMETVRKKTRKQQLTGFRGQSTSTLSLRGGLGGQCTLR